MPATLLIAEDSRTQREVLRGHLQYAGYEVLVAADGEQALEHLRHHQCDMLISDIVMPRMDGYELCRLAKQHQPQLPVVLLTSLSDPLDVVHGLQSGADNFLRKPYAFSNLHNRIEMMLQNKELRASGRAQAGVELFFLNQRFLINAERQQILDLLVSTFEDLVTSNQQLRQHEDELAAARDQLAEQLGEAQAQRDRLSAVLRAVPQALAVVDPQEVVVACSDVMCWFLGVQSSGDVEGRRLPDLLPLWHYNGETVLPHERPTALALRSGRPQEMGRSFDLLAERADGRRVPILLQAAPVRDASGRIAGAVKVAHELDALSLHDPLTRMYSHNAFAQQVGSAVQAMDAQQLAAVAVLVVDRSAELRDSLGAERMNRLTAALADRVRAALEHPQVRQHTAAPTAGYLGDSEFAVLLPGLVGEAQGLVAADGVRRQVAGPYRVDDLEVEVVVTAGFSSGTRDTARAEDLVPEAAAAAHLGSRNGGDRLESSLPGAGERAAERLRSEADLRRGIERDELRVVYQPIISFEKGVAGVEALVRWQHPEKGLQSPAEFLPLAEESGLVVPLGWEVLQQSCRQMARWRNELPGALNLSVSVNLSPRQLVQPDVADRVQHALADSGLPPRALSLEVTEVGMVSDDTAAIARLDQLRSMGVGISVDDFGTGYSSLLQLRRLPVDTLKVDRAFVDGLMTDPDDAVIVSASVSLAIALRLKVVAEGVENEEQAEELQRLGCDFGQGYLWSRPLMPQDFEQWWASTSVG